MVVKAGFLAFFGVFAAFSNRPLVETGTPFVVIGTPLVPNNRPLAPNIMPLVANDGLFLGVGGREIGRGLATGQPEVPNRETTLSAGQTLRSASEGSLAWAIFRIFLIDRKN